jgi:hypothetical protein
LAGAATAKASGESRGDLMATEDAPLWPDRPSGRLRLPAPSPRRVKQSLVGAALLGYSWWAGTTVPFTRNALVIVLLPGAVLGVIAYGRPPQRIPPPDNLDLLGSCYWMIAIAALFEWEASAFRDFTNTWHPPLSNLVGPLLDAHPVKAAAVLAWLLAGWGLVRR